MIIDVGDTIFYKDKVWEVTEIEKDFWFDSELEKYHFDNGEHLYVGSLTHREILKDYVKDGRCIIPKAKYREIRINEIFED